MTDMTDERSADDVGPGFLDAADHGVRVAQVVADVVRGPLPLRLRRQSRLHCAVDVVHDVKAAHEQAVAADPSAIRIGRAVRGVPVPAACLPGSAMCRPAQTAGPLPDELGQCGSLDPVAGSHWWPLDPIDGSPWWTLDPIAWSPRGPSDSLAWGPRGTLDFMA